MKLFEITCNRSPLVRFCEYGDETFKVPYKGEFVYYLCDSNMTKEEC
jgi:hypothetical protein